MSKSIILTPSNWRKLKERLEKDYPASVMLIRGKMRARLGFTAREHVSWEKNKNSRWQCEKFMYLDFYSEKKRTFFIMKYSEYLSHES